LPHIANLEGIKTTLKTNASMRGWY